ncbi:MAG TPA: translocation/assembly module TamB domain-containing protein [Saprospiraceae bacterium]|nr:translocation/assembly module TamB domain-containing protein [Saprospiraceae bacterium]
MNDTRPATRGWRKALRALLLTVSVLIFLLVIAIYALSLPAVQQRLTGKAEDYLHEKLGTRVEVGAIRLRFPFYVSLERFLLEDRQGDTLARAGRLMVDIDMWQLLNQTIEIDKIVLENAGIHLYRKDSIYNYDFITEAFAKQDTLQSAPVNTTRSPWKLKLDLATLDLKSVEFILQDEDAGTIIRADVGAAQAVLNTADLAVLHFDFQSLALADSDIRYQETKINPENDEPAATYDFLLQEGEIVRSHVLYINTELHFEATLAETNLKNLRLRSGNNGMAIQIGKIDVGQSAMTYREPEPIPTPGHLNPGDLDFTKLDADISDFSFQNDTLLLQANDMSGIEKSGVEVHSLKAGFYMTPSCIGIQDAVATMNQTGIEGDILLFRNKKDIFDRMQFELRKAKGIVGDLLLVIAPLENASDYAGLQNMPFEVSGNGNGWLQNLQIQNIHLRAGTGTVAHLNGSVQHLDQPDKLGMNLRISRLETNRADLIGFMGVGGQPMDSILATPLPAFLNTSGSLTGSMERLQISLIGMAGDLQTGSFPPPATGQALQFYIAGTLTEVNDPDQPGMDLVIHRLEAPRSFFAFLESKDVQLPDRLTATGTLKGTLAALQTNLKFNMIRGSGKSDLAFSGLLTNLRNPEKTSFDVVYKGDFTRQEILGYVADSLVNKFINLPATVQVEGKAKGTVDDLRADATVSLDELGKLHLDGALRDSTYSINLIGENLRVGQLAADTSLRPLKTVGLTADIKGEGFQFGETARLQVTGKFDSVIWENMVLRDIALDAAVDGKKFSGGLLSPDERAAVKIRASGDLAAEKNLLETDISINCLDLQEFGWSLRPTTVCMHIRSRSEGLSLDSLSAHATIENIDLQYDTVHIRPGDLTLDVALNNNHNNLDIESDWLKGEIKGFFSIADLPATLNNITEQYFLIDRTGFVAPVGTDSLSVRLELLQPQLLTSGLIPGLYELGVVTLDGLLDARRNYFDLDAEVTHFKYLNWEVDSLKARGYAADTAALFLVTTPRVLSDDKMYIQNAVLNGRWEDNDANLSFTGKDDAGKDRFLITARAQIAEGGKETFVFFDPQQIIDSKTWSVDAGNRIRLAGGSMEVKNLTLQGNGQSVKIEGATEPLDGNRTGLDFTVDIDRLNYGNFDLFASTYLRELEGWAEANLKITGATDALNVRGSVQLHETVFTPTLTNVRYKLSETPLEFTSEGVVLDGLILRDPYDNTLEIKGKLATTDWKNIRSDLSLRAGKWQALNTTRQQNSLYFGHVFVTLEGTVTGPVSEPDIRLNVKTVKESDFTYVYDVATQQLQHEGIVLFIQPRRRYVRPTVYDAPVTRNSFSLSASLEIDSSLTIHSVINPVTGDDFNGTAMGQLQLDLYPNGNMELSGRMEIVRGIYNYSYQSVVSRSFQVASGSSIIWSGDIRNPEMNLKARYLFRVAPYPLVISQLSTVKSEEADLYRNKQTFFLQTNINGTPNQPEVNFKFVYPPDEAEEGVLESFGNRDQGLVRTAIISINEDPNLLSRQVFGVLLLKNFIGESVSFTNTVSGDPLRAGLNNFLTGQVNALADQYLPWIEVSLDAREAPANNSGQSENATNYQLSLQKSFFDDRLTFKISGATSVDDGSITGSTSLENGSVEYALTRDGGLKLTVFSEKGFELLNTTASNLRNSGAGLIATKEFDSSRKRRKKQQ